MPAVAVGLDFAKTVFQAHGVDDASQTVLRRGSSCGKPYLRITVIFRSKRIV